MKKLVLVFAIAMIAIAGSAFAQFPNYQNNAGIYLDEQGLDNCALLGETPIDVGFTAYLVFTKMTEAEILGWELKVTYDNLYLTGLAPRGEHIDAASRIGEYLVGFPAPVPVVGNTFVAADIELLVITYQSTSPSEMFIDGVYFHLLDDKVPAYLNGASEGIALHQVNGGAEDPVFVLNTPDCFPVAEETSSWGSVKSLYR